MSLKVVLLICVVLKNLNLIVGQNDVLSCNYYLTGSPLITSCSLQIYNPRGLNNFYTIGGSTSNYNTTKRIYKNSNTYWHSPIVPTILCDKFIILERMEFGGLGIKNTIIIGDENPFKKCSNLLYLDLCDNKISDIDKMPFSANTKLQELRLCNNELGSIPENIFSSLINLKVLWLNGNQLVDIPENIFQNLQNLERLDLQNNSLTTMNSKWFEALLSKGNLKLLNLGQNQIKFIPDNSFSYLQKLDTLYLYSNSLEVIHSSSFGILPNLKNVRFDNNKIDAIDVDFINNTGIVSINMIGNICSNENIFDNSTLRYSMKIMLSECFENYEEYETGPTTHSPGTTIYTTKQVTTTYPSTPPKCSNENIDERVCGIEDEIDVLKEAIGRLDYRIIELSNRPCACS